MQDQERQVGLGALLDGLGVFAGEQRPGPGQVVAAPQHVADKNARAQLHRHAPGLLPHAQCALGQVTAHAPPGDEFGDGLEGEYLRHQRFVTEPGSRLEGGHELLGRSGGEFLGADPQDEAHVPVDLRAERGAFARLAERPAQQWQGGGGSLQVTDDPGQVVQRGGPQRAGLAQRDRLFQQFPCALRVERGQVEPASIQQALHPFRHPVRRGEPDSQVGEFRAGDRGAPEVRDLGRRGEPGRQLLVRPGGCQGEVAHLALRRAGHLRQPLVGLAALPGRRAGIVHRAEQWVGEADPVVVDAKHTHLLGGVQPVPGGLVIAAGGHDGGHGRSRGRRRDQRHLPACGGEGLEPALDEWPQRPGDGERLAGAAPAAVGAQGCRQFQREVGIPPGRLVHLDHFGPGLRRAALGAEHRVQRRHGQRPGREDLQLPGREPVPRARSRAGRIWRGNRGQQAGPLGGRAGATRTQGPRPRPGRARAGHRPRRSPGRPVPGPGPRRGRRPQPRAGRVVPDRARRAAAPRPAPAVAGPAAR